MTTKSEFDPNLEELRNSIELPIDATEILNEILSKTKNIHAGYLFWRIGDKLLQILCRCLCATRNSLHYDGWKQLGNQLGLDDLVLNSIDNQHLEKEDPAYTMFKAYVQKDDSTIGKIYSGILKIDRKDIITRTHPYVLNFYDEMCKNFNVPQEDKILKPLRIPTPPHILRNFDEQKQDETVKPDSKNVVKYDKFVMLTYTSKDASIAQEIAKELKEERNGKVIGVVVLDEHVDKILTEREKLILNLFTRADYILPIVSTEYLTSVFGENEPGSAIDNMDGVYVNFIYDLMTNQYMRSGCKNKKIRCIIPNDEFYDVQSHFFFQNPIFRAWVKSSNTSDLANKILESKI